MCDMAVLYLRNVSDDLMRRLRLLASREQMSVSAAALRELEEATRWVDIPELFEALPDMRVPTAEILAVLDEGRSAR